MTDEDHALLLKYGITIEHKTIYLYKSYRYDHLKDAVNYAKSEAEKDKVALK